MAGIIIDKDRCIGCKLCVGACPFSAMIMVDGKAETTDECTVCGACMNACRKRAILFDREQSVKINDISGYSGIWVFAEQYQGKLKNVALELLARARALSCDLNCKVSAVLLGFGADALAKKLIDHGADEVLLADAPWLEDRNEQIYGETLVKLVHERKPEIFLIGATSFGRSLAPSIASELNTGLTADCLVLEIDKKKKLLQQTRPAFGGNLMATIICPNHRPQMATVRPRVFKALEADPARKGDIIRFCVTEPKEILVKTIQKDESFNQEERLADADIIVAVGRGIGSAKNIKLAEELAKALGGVVGASRPVVDLGWMPYTRQIGQTGKTIAPKLYVACGISGAIQHLAGLSEIDTVVAINSDSDAPIFKVAHFGLVGDCLEILPELTTQVRKIKAKSN